MHQLDFHFKNQNNPIYTIQYVRIFFLKVVNFHVIHSMYVYFTNLMHFDDVVILFELLNVYK